MQPITVLYVGDKAWGETLRASAESLNWHVYVPNDLREALGIYVSLFPDVVVLDAAADAKLAEAVHFHLQSVNGGPVIVLTGKFQPEWLEATGDYVLSRTDGLENVISALQEFHATHTSLAY